MLSQKELYTPQDALLGHFHPEMDVFIIKIKSIQQKLCYLLLMYPNPEKNVLRGVFSFI